MQLTPPEISYLKDRPAFIPVLAPEIVNHWRPFLPELTLEGVTAKLESHLQKEKLPIAWVARARGRYHA